MNKDILNIPEDGEAQRQLEICASIAEENRSRYGEISPGFYIQTFGCQQNEADSERMAGLAVMMGYRPVAKPKKKNKKHIQIWKKENEALKELRQKLEAKESVRDEEIKRTIKLIKSSQVEE